LIRLKPPYQYIIDSSALFDLKNNYPEHIFPGVWERFNEMFEQQQIVSAREVYREILKGNDELVAWADRFIDNFLLPCQEELELFQEIMVLYPSRIIEKVGTRPWADPLLIAAGRYYRLPIIQHEKSLDPNQWKIPFMAKKFKITCYTLVEFFEEENWSFITG
jgi:hypothetical protein